MAHQMPSQSERETFDLCGACGVTTSADLWTAWDYGEMAGELIAAPEGEAGAFYTCPACRFEHQDDDSDPGVWSGTLAEMEAERARLVIDGGWPQWWAERWAEVAREIEDAV